jgi:hypothetical protein
MSKDAILFRPRARDTTSGVTRRTLKRLAKLLDVAESEVIHRALAKYAHEHLPRYEPDDGPLTAAQHRSIADRVRREHGEAQTIEALFDEGERRPRDRTTRVRTASRSR